MDFEWDERKRLSNLAKHGIDFRVAVSIFLGHVLERRDERRNYREVRMIATGLAHGTEITLVYAKRGSIRRVISARRAHKNERKAYRARFPF
ncbi:MAG TPA: BrnT family toxin [Candidatus Acidoferrales bacterium]|nr:BrnT family toxin [Candidatus Acidoferrales bacterium]